jgi:pyridoxal phosphate-dependent aminotransferase EpsN
METTLKRIYLSVPHMSGNELGFIKEAFDLNWVTCLGANVDGFEKDISNYLNIPHVVALSSGTAALHLALRAIGTKPGDHVLCSTLTFSASANPIIYEGAIPIFVDCDAETWNLSPIALEKAFVDCKKNGIFPKAVIAVGLYGQSADMDPICEISKKYGALVIEDAAEALGATYKNKKAGSLGDLSILSFNGNKIITTSGGGALLSENKEWIDRARYLSTQARQPVPHYEHTEVGYNYRMSNILAGIGRAQMAVLDDRVAARRNVFLRYQEAFQGLPGIHLMPEASYGLSTRWLTALRIDPKIQRVPSSQLISSLSKMNIEARPAWKPMHLQPVFKSAKFYSTLNSGSVADDIFSEGLCLPSSSNLAIEDQIRTINLFKEALKS